MVVKIDDDILLPPPPLSIIEDARKKYGIKKFIGLFSGGKDSLAVCHYMHSQKVMDEVLYLRTGIGVKENFEFVLDTCNKYKWKLNVMDPKPQFTYEVFVKRFGFPHSGIHNAIMGFLKWFQIRQFAKDHKDECIAFLSGRRKKESARRKFSIKSMYAIDKPEKNIVMVAPLFFWTTKDIWDYIDENNLQLCPVYKTLHLSGDCLCGSFAELGESEMIKTFHPDLAQKIVSLEKKYGGKWGNHVSMTGTMNQKKINEFVCNECVYDRRSK